MRALGMVGLLAVGLATATQAAEMPNTNLLCVGKEEHREDRTVILNRKYREIFRIDYERNRWCQGKCEYALPILSVSDEMIVLMLSGAASGGVNRVTGKLETVYVVPLENGKTLRQFVEATCTAQPFTGTEPPPPGPKPVPKF